MDYLLENDFVKIGVKVKGAELCSYFDKQSKTEHVWQADPNVWGRHAPILFPLVGQVEGGEYTVNGKVYKMGQHGFARDLDFMIIEEGHDVLTFELKSNNYTRERYPFNFSLKIKYLLSGKKLTVTYSVLNTDNKEIFFNLGGHPGFCVPFDEKESVLDYYLNFSEKETLDRILLTSSGLVSGKIKESYLSQSSKIPLSSSLFDDDALVFSRVKSEFISIKNAENHRELRFGLGDFPFLGIWSKPKAKAPYVCIEPWYGHTAVLGNSTEISQRVGVSSLTPSGILEDSFSIEVL